MKSTEMATKKPVREMTLEELYAKRDRTDSGNLILGLDFLQEEIFRRNCDAQNAKMVTMTRTIQWLTAAVAVLTLVVTVATITLLRRDEGAASAPPVPAVVPTPSDAGTSPTDSQSAKPL